MSKQQKEFIKALLSLVFLARSCISHRCRTGFWYSRGDHGAGIPCVG